jgi:hypothetical protein
LPRPQLFETEHALAFLDAFPMTKARRATHALRRQRGSAGGVAATARSACAAPPAR